MLGHGLAQLAPQLEGILAAFVAYELFIDLRLPRNFRRRAAVAIGRGHALGVRDGVGPGLESAKDATDKRVCAQPVGAVVLVLALAAGKDAGDVRHLVEVHPKSAHRVVHARKDLHRLHARIDADELLVDFEDAAELVVQRLAIDVRQVEINHRLAVESEAEFIDHFVDGARGHVARHQVADTSGTTLLKSTSALIREWL